MKLLVFSDLHTSAEAARSLLARAAGADLLIGAGDFANQHRGLNICLDILAACGKPALLVPGNNETPEALRDACRGWPGARVLHGEGFEVLGRSFFGLGGGVPPTVEHCPATRVVFGVSLPRPLSRSTASPYMSE